MRIHSFFLSAGLLMTGVRATVDLAALLPLVPQCSFPCIAAGLASTPNGLINPTVLCTNNTLAATISACIQGRCNYTEQFQVAMLNGQLCEGFPIETRSKMMIIFSLVFGSLALLAVALRVYSRLSISMRLGWDDWLILVAASFLLTLTILDVYTCSRNGFGRHYWNVNPLRVTELLKILYAGEVFYLVIMMLVKASILIFYLRIFTSRWFRIASISVLAATIASGLAGSFVVIGQCAPIRGVWDRTIPSKCLNINALAFALGGISIALDIFILILPIPELIPLQMNFKKKLNLLFMFSLGSFACITSIVRLKYLVNFAKSTDSTYDNTIAVIWTLLEFSVAIICACLPSIRALLSHKLPALFDITNQYSKTHDTELGTLPRKQKPEKLSLSYDKYPTPLITANGEQPSFSPRSSLPTESGIEPTSWINSKFDSNGEFVSFQFANLNNGEMVTGEGNSERGGSNANLWLREAGLAKSNEEQGRSGKQNANGRSLT